MTCTYPGTSAIAAGTNLPAVSLPASVATGFFTKTTSLETSVTVSSDDGDPATASDAQTVSVVPPSLTSVTLAAECPGRWRRHRTIPLDNNGALPTETQQSQVSGTTSGSSNDTTNNQVVDLAIGDLAAKNIAAKNIAAKNIAVKNLDLDDIASEVAIPGQDPLADISLSNINVTYPDACDPTAALGTTNACTGWGGSWPARSTPPRPVSSSGLSRP